jgi:hypothetical protein
VQAFGEVEKDSIVQAFGCVSNVGPASCEAQTSVPTAAAVAPIWSAAACKYPIFDLAGKCKYQLGSKKGPRGKLAEGMLAKTWKAHGFIVVKLAPDTAEAVSTALDSCSAFFGSSKEHKGTFLSASGRYQAKPSYDKELLQVLVDFQLQFGAVVESLPMLFCAAGSEYCLQRRRRRRHPSGARRHEALLPRAARCRCKSLSDLRRTRRSCSPAHGSNHRGSVPRPPIRPLQRLPKQPDVLALWNRRAAAGGERPVPTPHRLREGRERAEREGRERG